MLRTGAASDPLNGLALAWVASMIPVTLLILATLGLSFALAMLAVSFLPAAGVWVFHRRVAARVGRFGRRRARGAQGTAGLHGSTTEPGNTSSDARSR
jgi:membrane protein implicated in regulation of membrane protease activity